MVQVAQHKTQRRRRAEAIPGITIKFKEKKSETLKRPRLLDFTHKDALWCLQSNEDELISIGSVLSIINNQGHLRPKNCRKTT